MLQKRLITVLFVIVALNEIVFLFLEEISKIL